MEVLKFVAHSKKAISIALDYGWLPGARYTNLRDVRSVEFKNIGFLDIDWKNYNFSRHLDIAAQLTPKITIARDIENIQDLDCILEEAYELKKYSKVVAVVPKDERLEGRISDLIPRDFMLGYSVPTRYGGTSLSIENFDRPVHLLGGRPEIQRALANQLKVFSLDCNRFTYDARFGDYFDGEIFRPHPVGGYEKCLSDSIMNINSIWTDYKLFR